MLYHFLTLLIHSKIDARSGRSGDSSFIRIYNCAGHFDSVDIIRIGTVQSAPNCVPPAKNNRQILISVRLRPSWCETTSFWKHAAYKKSQAWSVGVPQNQSAYVWGVRISAYLDFRIMYRIWCSPSQEDHKAMYWQGAMQWACSSLEPSLS